MPLFKHTSISATFSRDLFVVVLAAVSGYVDAVSYLGLEQVFTANMTGNTVLLGLAVGAGDLDAALRSGVALMGYIIGVVLGVAIVHEHEKGMVWPAEVTRALALECIVLLALAAGGIRLAEGGGDNLLMILITFSAIAMGIQSVAVRPLSIPGITTTYITGTWTSLVTEVAVRLRLVRTRNSQGSGTPRPSSGARLQAMVLVVYGVAAVAGGAANAKWHVPSIFIPAIAIGLVAILAPFVFPRPEPDTEETDT